MATNAPKRVRHIVLMKFREDCSEATHAMISKSMHGMKGKIPGILKLSYGPSFTTDRADGFTHVLVVDLVDKLAFEVYAIHAEHIRIIKDEMFPNFGDFPNCVAVDIKF
eukprot:CAMPEP_0179441076 /NCGR_PEP_ID=MMETSP0799-20121207/24671_1 /TAXON_ID=46947 /ORGANISM="Geminigera cryophila, Strain CCMP2564" /LENGTH=108 /DNA_ID=CAMNT_0021225055 /DNA_START=68 /DNA_END=394 /DNA_ORIENTATION=+